jgi:hypothetical protein
MGVIAVEERFTSSDQRRSAAHLFSLPIPYLPGHNRVYGILEHQNAQTPSGTHPYAHEYRARTPEQDSHR